MSRNKIGAAEPGNRPESTRAVPPMRSIAHAVTLLTLVALACFAAQAALPRPARGNLIAARALQHLSPFRPVTAVPRLTGKIRRVNASCASHQLIRPRSTGITVGPGRRVFLDDRRAAFTAAAASVPQLKFRLPACPVAIRAWVGAELNRARPVAIASVWYSGRPTYRLTFSTRPLLIVYVDRATLVFIGVNVHFRHWPRFTT
jgi:hypothetical protein